MAESMEDIWLRVGLKSLSEFHGKHRYFADQQC